MDYGKINANNKPVLLTDDNIYCVGGGRLLSDIIYPIGSIYLSVVSTNPSEYFGGTWEQIGSGRVLMGVTDNNQSGTTVNSGLPNITGEVRIAWSDLSASSTPIPLWSGAGALYPTDYGNMAYAAPGVTTNSYNRAVGLNASRSNKIYGSSNIVQPPAYYCYMWRRIS